MEAQDDNHIEMTYRDNEVRFISQVQNTGESYNLVRGSYTIDEFSITSGQDPQGKIQAGQVRNFGSDGKFSFSIGRKKSSAVANWFNSKVTASQTTFNHSAGELNFAFIGTLRLTITGGILGNRQEEYYFNRVALAQGNAGASNNWWFGGQNCSNIGSNRVKYRGFHNSGTPVELTFWRGTNNINVNVIEFLDLSLVDTSNWMGKLPASTKLNQIVMPGSHDAGMYTTSHCAPPIGAPGLSKTQSLSVAQQLSNGSRYFDIRVDYDYNELVTYHRSDQWGCNGGSLQAILDGTRNFLRSQPSETAILKFSHIRNDSGHDASATKRRIDALLGEYADFIYKNTTTNVNLAETQLGDVRGKMILVFDYSDFIAPANGRFRYYDGSTPQANITVFDRYSDTKEYGDMERDQLEKWRSYGGLGKGYLFLLSWTLTPQGILGSVEDLAAVANTRLPGALSRAISEYRTKPNIVYVDFLDSRISQTIIQYNF